MKIKHLIAGFLTLLGFQVFSFCGFYVAKADAKLFNKSSQVIIARNGNYSTITMANDFQGAAKDFAMVVPVPVVLKDNDIRVIKKNVFERFDSYSAPRLAEYHDPNPCYQYKMYENKLRSFGAPSMKKRLEAEELSDKEDIYQVKIEAQYEKGEYDILILSAKESNGLKRWLIDNGYKIPSKANEALDPYIKDGLKFFVVKVNLNRLKQKRGSYLSPIQISFNSPKFMLPIRLGMANANGTQDMIVYVLSTKGRVETANYRTMEMPSNRKIPLFINQHFGPFYKSVFSKKWTNNKSSVFVEYSWDLSSSNFTKCDPCSTTPPSAQELKDAGVNWLSYNGNRWGAQYQGNLHFTRLHVRYDRAHFPQDLSFVETNNKKRFQCRYVLNHPANVTNTCSQVLSYYEKVQNRRRLEINNLAELTWWDTKKYNAYLKKYPAMMDELKMQNNINEDSSNTKKGQLPWILVLVVGTGLMAWYKRKGKLV